MTPTVDLCLAGLHHLGILTVFLVLAAEFVLLRMSPTVAWVRPIARVDLYYGIAAGVVLAAGFGRVAWGAKGASFYLGNLTFWLKLAVFLVIGIISVLPSLQCIRWRRGVDTQGALPDAQDLAAAQCWVNLQLMLFVGLPVLAAMMVRGIGYRARRLVLSTQETQRA